MDMERLWAPWRLAYVQDVKSDSRQTERNLELLPGGDPDCFICRAVVENADRQNLVVDRTQHAIIILNRFPYNNGHLLIAPRLHKAELSELDVDEQLEISQAIARMIEQLRKLMHPEGFNVGVNLGRIAGAGLPGHVHWHIVPRWNGDTNFMPVLAGIKVIPQSLDSLWELLTDAASR